MKKTTGKGLEPKIIKYLAMLMGICYLMHPLQKPINSLLHKVSHSIESPTHIISHSSISNLAHKSNDHLDSSLEMDHEHGIVDIIRTIFEASNEKNDSDGSLLKDVKIDKHIVTYQFQLQKHSNKTVQKKNWTLHKKFKQDYFEKIKRPPQYLLG